MIRVSLIAYLSLASALGPALCCCNARRLVALVQASSSQSLSCCSSHSKTATSPAHLHRHHHHHGGAAHDHAHSAAPSHDSNEKPCKHDGKSCPCGRHQANLVATPVRDSSRVAAPALHDGQFHVVPLKLSVLPEIDLQEVSISAHARPAHLFGTEILRAYQTLRC
jgi:hypothetical protein